MRRFVHFRSWGIGDFLNTMGTVQSARFLTSNLVINSPTATCSTLSFQRASFQNVDSPKLNDDLIHQRLVDAIDKICLEAKPVQFKKDRDRLHSEYVKLLKQLEEFENPIEHEESEKVQQNIMLQQIILDLNLILPRLSQPEKVGLFDVLARKNIRDLEFLKAVAQSICNGNQRFYYEEVSIMASAAASLTFHDPLLINVLKTNFLFHKENWKRNLPFFATIVKSFSRLKLTDEVLWSTIVDHIDFLNKKENLDKSLLKQLTIIVVACCTANIPIDSCLSRCITRIIKDTNFSRMNPQTLAATAHTLACAQRLPLALAKLVLNKKFLKRYIRDLKHVKVPTITCYYNAMRLLSISTYAKLESIEDNTNYSTSLLYFNPLDIMIGDPEKEEMIWKLKYTSDLTSLHHFRNLLQCVAPLETHLTEPYIDMETGVLVEGNVLVQHNEIIMFSNFNENSSGNEAPVKVAVLYFTVNHTTVPDDESPECLERIRLTGPCQMAVRFLKKSNQNVFPVVITEHELNALNNDEQRKTFIAERIKKLSCKFHQPNNE